MKVLLTGADGFIGRHLAISLLDAGHVPVPAGRRQGIDFRNMLLPKDWVAHLQGVDAVINCAGVIQESVTGEFECVHHLAPAALFHACVECGVKRVVQISALGADETAATPFLQSKFAADEVLRHLDLDWFVLRPGLIYGKGGISFRFFMQLARWPVLIGVGDGRQPVQPIHVSDVAATVMCCLTNDQPLRTLDVVGPSTLTLVEWLQLMRTAQSCRQTVILSIPVPVAMLLAGVAKHVSPMIQPATLKMLLTSNAADHHVLEEFLGNKLIVPSEKSICESYI
jgi:uncharacterized protein YbjT (DUF2867 family)